MRAAALLALLAAAVGCTAQFTIPASCIGRLTTLSQVLAVQPELQANCPASATTCSNACRTSLTKVRWCCGGCWAPGRPERSPQSCSSPPVPPPLPCPLLPSCSTVRRACATCCALAAPLLSSWLPWMLDSRSASPAPRPPSCRPRPLPLPPRVPRPAPLPLRLWPPPPTHPRCLSLHLPPSPALCRPLLPPPPPPSRPPVCPRPSLRPPLPPLRLPPCPLPCWPRQPPHPPSRACPAMGPRQRRRLQVASMSPGSLQVRRRSGVDRRVMRLLLASADFQHLPLPSSNSRTRCGGRG